MTIRVLVADDRSMVRAGFRKLLGGEEDIDVVAEASNGLEAVEKATRFQPTVVLMDIRMPELDGLEATGVSSLPTPTRGSSAVTKRVIRQFTRLSRPSPPAAFDELTARERDVVRLLAQGLSNAEIGKDLYIGETTVKTHVTDVLQKLDLRDRVQLVVLAYQTGLAGADEQQAGQP